MFFESCQETDLYSFDVHESPIKAQEVTKAFCYKEFGMLTKPRRLFSTAAATSPTFL